MVRCNGLYDIGGLFGGIRPGEAGKGVSRRASSPSTASPVTTVSTGTGQRGTAVEVSYEPIYWSRVVHRFPQLDPVVQDTRK